MWYEWKSGRWDKWRGTVGIVAVLLLMVAILAGCASVPVPKEPIPPAALRCAQNGPCIRIHVDNQLSTKGTFYLNGFRLGDVEPWSETDFWFRESMLVEGRCAYARAVYRLPGFALVDDRQCVRQGERFNILVGTEGKLWLQPRAMGQR